MALINVVLAFESYLAGSMFSIMLFSNMLSFLVVGAEKDGGVPTFKLLC